MEENFELAKWLSGEMSPEELKAFQASEQYKIYQKIAQYSAELEAPAFNEEEAYQRIVSRQHKETKTVSLYQHWMFKVAALFLLFLGLTIFYKANVSITEAASLGQQTTFTLPDDSQVVLNSGSEVHYSKLLWSNHRQLDLKGEAYFKVAKGKKFEVNTHLGKVTVLGTQFDVKARANRFDVTCYEGRVRVDYQKQQVIITKGMSVAFEDGQLIAIPNTKATQPEWTQAELAFNKEKLSQVLQELERQFDCQIECNTTANSQLFTGTLPKNDIHSALQILSANYHLKIKQVSDRKIILNYLDAEK